MGIDPRGLAMAMGDAEARLNAVKGRLTELEAKWNDPQALQNRLMDLFIANPTEQAKENLIDWINVSSRLNEMSPKELVDVALKHLSDNVEDHNYELIVEQLCTRVWPNWSNEDPSPAETEAKPSRMCPECHAIGGPDGVTDCATCRGGFWEEGCEHCGSLEVNPKCPACNGIER